jgi:branched-chain amino acid transport system substrate-binding protein
MANDIFLQASHLSKRPVAVIGADLAILPRCMRAPIRKLGTMLWRVMALAATLAAPAVAQAQTVVKIGVLTDMSSVDADLSGQGSVVAARMAVEDFRAEAKGINVEIVSADHQNKPDVGSAVTRQWLEADQVDMIVDVPSSAVALAVNAIVREKNKVLLVSGAATPDLTGKACSPNTVHWTYDTWALTNGTGKGVVKTGGDTWFFLIADYPFGRTLERDTEAAVVAAGGKVVGNVRHALSAADFSSFLQQAQASKAKVIGLANAGGDTMSAIRRAAELGIVAGGQRLAGLLVFITDVHALGLKAAQGLTFTETFYWDRTEASRAFAQRFAPQLNGVHPTMIHAGVYAAVTHYLKAIEALQSPDDGAKVVAKMKEMPTDDPLFEKGTIRADGRKIHPAYLVEVKKPEESKHPWDYHKIRATVPADQAFRPIDKGDCPLVKQ